MKRTGDSHNYIKEIGFYCSIFILIGCTGTRAISVPENIEDIENTTDLMASYIDGVNTDLNKDKLKTLMNSLYNDALDMEIQ